MPRDDGLMEEFDNKSFYHYFNDTFKEENVNEERKRPPSNTGFDFRAGSSLRNELNHRGSKTLVNENGIMNEFQEMTLEFSDCLGTRNTKIDPDRFIDLASKKVCSKVARKRLVSDKKKSLKCEKCGGMKWSARFMFGANGEDETVLECSKCDVT